MIVFYAQLKYCHIHYNLILFRGGKTSQQIIQEGKYGIIKEDYL